MKWTSTAALFAPFPTFLWEDSTLDSFLRRHFLEQAGVFAICLSQLTNPNYWICVRCETSYNSYYQLDSFSFLLSLCFLTAFPEQLVAMAYVVLLLFFQFVMCVLWFLPRRLVVLTVMTVLHFTQYLHNSHCPRITLFGADERPPSDYWDNHCLRDTKKG